MITGVHAPRAYRPAPERPSSVSTVSGDTSYLGYSSENRQAKLDVCVKRDLKKELKHLYAPSATEVTLVDVPEMQFVTVCGRIEAGETPGTCPAFAEAVGALYSLSYTIKFMSKLREVEPVDYTVMPLEGLWTTPGGGIDYQTSDEWLWTLAIMQPEHVTEEVFAEASNELRRKKPTMCLEGVRLDRLREGLCVQILHIGPYADEPHTVDKMASWAAENGYRFRGPHHEIYLGDPRAARPENLRTVLRHSVEPAE